MRDLVTDWERLRVMPMIIFILFLKEKPHKIQSSSKQILRIFAAWDDLVGESSPGKKKERKSKQKLDSTT